MPNDSTLDLAEIQSEIGEWHREQFPDVPFEAIRDKLECEVREYLYARTMFLARRSYGNEKRWQDEAADVLITMLADIERLTGAGSFHDALARKWAEVKARDYRGDS